MSWPGVHRFWCESIARERVREGEKSVILLTAFVV